MTAKPEPEPMIRQGQSEPTLERPGSWTLRVRQLVLRELPPNTCCPTANPPTSGPGSTCLGP